MALHRTSRSLIAAAIVAGAIVGSALPASAYHPVLSGKVACVAGEQVVTWTVENSESTSDTGRSMIIDSVSVNHGTLSGIQAGMVFPPRPLPGSVRNATTVLPGNQTGGVKLTVQADWDRNGWQDIVMTVRVNLPGDCRNTPTTTVVTAAQPTTTTTAAPTTTTTTAVRIAPEPTLPTEMVETQVLGEQQARPAPTAALPRTGIPAAGAALGGLGLILAGVPLSRLRRRNR